MSDNCAARNQEHAKSVDVPIAIQPKDAIVEVSQIHRNEDGTIALIGSESGHLASGATCAALKGSP